MYRCERQSGISKEIQNMKFLKQNTAANTANLYATQVVTQTTILRLRLAPSPANSNASTKNIPSNAPSAQGNNTLSSRRMTGSLTIRFPESAVLTIDSTSTSPSLRVTTDGKQSGKIGGVKVSRAGGARQGTPLVTYS
jgi:hypothetical protein